MTKTTSGAARTAPILKAKISIGLPFRIVSEATGKPVIEGQLYVVPDNEANPRTKASIPCMPDPIVLRRKNFACLLKQWRNHPETVLSERNWPTTSDLIGMVVREALEKTLRQNLDALLA